ncbi:MAG: hypothetical protein KAV41_01595 [Candidatus Pacebacteria bacterium]|nr:hypothetical protein [Candidatus Paceibacterota bacterium]
MNTIAISKEKVGAKTVGKETEKFKMKANILDGLLEFIEDKYFGHFMKSTETESNLSLSKAKKLMR